MSVEVASFHKPGPVECGCGCGLVGVLRAQEWRDGSRCVKRGCSCRRCLGLRNRRKGQKGQARASRLLGVPRSSIRPGHEELSGGAIRWEHKAGAQAKPVVTRYRHSAAQSEAARSVGDHRPFAATFNHDGAELAVIDMNDLPEFCAAFMEQYEKWSAS